MSVVSGAASGAVAGSALGPWGAAGGALIGGLGSLLAGNSAADKAKAAARQYAASAAEGRSALSSGRAQATSEYNPYTKLGSQMASQYGAEVAKGQSQPTFSYTPEEFNFSTNSDPGAQYRMEQANKALQASAIAKGGMGGGFAKALQTSSQNMASQEYANSWQRNMDKNKFGYQQSSDAYNRNYTSQQDYLNRLKSGAESGQNAVGNLAGIQQGYDTATNSNWLSQGQAQLNAAMTGTEAQTAGMSGMFSGLGSALGTGLQSYFGNSAAGNGLDSSVTRGSNWLGTGNG